MKELWDEVIKVIPPQALPALLLIACAFFGVYDAKGLRSYTDAANDRWFLTATIFIIAGFLIYLVHRTELPQLGNDQKVALLVPKFDDDENRQFENLFSQQVQAAIHTLQAQATVVQFDGYVRDRSEATLLAKALKTSAVIFQPKVVRTGSKTYICFSLFTAGTEATKPYPPLPAEIEKATLDDLSSTIVGVYVPADASGTESLAARLVALEQRVAALTSAIRNSSTSTTTNPAKTYIHRRAIVVGVNRVETKDFPQLASAVSDARGVAAMLKSAGYETTVLLDDGATRASLNDALARVIAAAQPGDLTTFYYAGTSFSPTNFVSAHSAADLVLTTFDVTLAAPQSNEKLSQIVQELRNAPGDKLIILDGCHGTYGLPASPRAADTKSGETFQVLASSQDDEVAADLPGGGLFTQALLKELRRQEGQGKSISTSTLLASVFGDVVEGSRGMQHPKLVRISGSNDIMLPVPTE